MSKDKKKSLYMLLNIALSISGDYLKDFQGMDIEMESDLEVTSCMFKLYILLLTSSSSTEYEERFEEFCKEFDNLSKEKQEYIKMDYLRVLREKEKIKKKEIEKS